MKLRTIRYYVKQGINNMRRNVSLSCASVVAIASALFVLGAILSIVFNLNHIVRGIESRMEVTLFLESGTTYEKIASIEETINNWNGVTDVNFISRHNALAAWKKELGDQGRILEGYTNENNPLPDYFIISADKPEYVDEIANSAQNLESVEKVSYSKPVVEFIERVANLLHLGGITLVLMLLFISVLIISNTIRVTVFSRKKEIGIMKYIGATDWFIRWPFIVEGLFLGLTGAFLSSALVLGIYYAVYYYSRGMLLSQLNMDFLNLLSLFDIAYPLLMVFLPLGSSIGIVASALSLRKHLRV
jgi:cell division transport system permease protein